MKGFICCNFFIFINIQAEKMKGLKIINESELLEMLGTNRDDSSLAVEMESTMEVETTQPKVTYTLHFISY